MQQFKIKYPMKRRLKKIAESEDSDQDYCPDDDIRDDSEVEGDYQDDVKESSQNKRELKKIKNYLCQQLPNIKTILETKLFLEDKAKLVELFERWKMAEELSEDWVNLKDKYHLLLREYSLRYQTASEEDQTKYQLCAAPMEQTLSEKLAVVATNDYNRACIKHSIDQLLKMGTSNDEYHKMRMWIDTALKVPFQKFREVPGNIIERAQMVLNQSFYGMKKVKEQLLLFLDARRRNPHMREAILGLIGPPGVGKTSIVRSLARINDLPFIQINCGGFNNADSLRGHDYSYIGSHNGIISQALIDANVKNPIIFLDEFEKATNNAAITHFFLHVTDPSQNSEYVDNYLNPLKIDLSSVFWVASMNEIPTDPALRDRMFPIYLESYSLQDKTSILLNHIIPEQCQELKLSQNDIIFPLATAKWFVSIVGQDEPGLRRVLHASRDLLKKIAFLKDNPKVEVNFQLKNLKFPLTLNKENILKLQT